MGYFKKYMSLRGPESVNNEALRSMGIAPRINVVLGQSGSRSPETTASAEVRTHPSDSITISQDAKQHPEVLAAMETPKPEGALSATGAQPMSYNRHASAEPIMDVRRFEQTASHPHVGTKVDRPA